MDLVFISFDLVLVGVGIIRIGVFLGVMRL